MDMDMDMLMRLASQIGFDRIGKVNMEALIPLSQVREMCQNGRCNRYGKSWSCPPACGSLEHARKRFSRYKEGILVQSICYREDDFDFDSLRKTEKEHKKRFLDLVRQVRSLEPACMPMAAGSCSVCHKCTYPQRPCRYPAKMIPSMEAYGLWISDICVKSGMQYNYGQGSVSFTACILINEKEDGQHDEF